MFIGFIQRKQPADEEQTKQHTKILRDSRNVLATEYLMSAKAPNRAHLEMESENIRGNCGSIA